MIAQTLHATRLTILVTLFLSLAPPTLAQNLPTTKPVELELLKASAGTWNCAIEVWPQGPDSVSIKFDGTETNEPSGDYWMASSFVSEFQGQTMKVHSLVGYDLHKKQLVGMVVDYGPYAATMTGKYNSQTKTVQWRTEVKDPTGKPIVQQTSITQKSGNERHLVLSVQGKKPNERVKFMEITYSRQK